MRILLDECLPRPLKRSIIGHTVMTVQECGWSSKKNGELLQLMNGTIDVFLTSESKPSLSAKPQYHPVQYHRVDRSR